MTQGRGGPEEYVTQFMVRYSQDAFKWDYVKDQYGGQKIFVGNSDPYSVRYVLLGDPIRARFIKVYVTRWQSHPALRLELLGCQECRTLIGYPPFGRMRASTEGGLQFRRRFIGNQQRVRRRAGRVDSEGTCTAEDGNILSNRAWCPRVANSMPTAVFIRSHFLPINSQSHSLD